MDTDVNKRIEEMEQKIELIYISVEKTRKYLLWTVIITIALIVLPLIGLALAIPSFLSTYTETINTLGI